MSNLSALRGKYNKFLRRCKAIHLKNARKLFLFDQKINQAEESTIGEAREVYSGGRE